MKKQPFDEVLTLKASVGTNDLETEVLGPGWLQCVQRVGVENETTAYTDLRLFKVGRAADFLFAEEDNPEAATFYWVDTPIYLMEGQRLRARLTGCTADDIIKVYLTGWKAKTSEITP